MRKISEKDVSCSGKFVAKDFSKLYEIYNPLVRRVIRRYIKDEPTISDLVQEVFITLWLKESQLYITQNLKGYLFRMAKNTTLNYLRTLKSQKEAMDKYEAELEVLDPYRQEDDYMALYSTHERIRELLSRLSERQRTAFTMCKLKGFTNKEAADHMAISISTLKEHLALAVRFLAKYL